MDAKRRSFLTIAGLAPATAAGFAGSVAPARPEAAGVLTRSAFAACVGDEFVFEQGALAQCALRLARVEPLVPGASAAESEHRFSVTFEAPAPGLAQETYRVGHARLGRFALFVSPKDPAGRILEAVFNRL